MDGSSKRERVVYWGDISVWCGPGILLVASSHEIFHDEIRGFTVYSKCILRTHKSFNELRVLWSNTEKQLYDNTPGRGKKG